MAIGYTEAVQATMLLTLALFVKFLVSNMMWGSAKVKAGKRSAEDAYQSQQPTAEDIAAEDRAARIVHNDMENIPFAVIIAWASIACLGVGVGVKEAAFNAHIAFFTLFTIFRIGHTVAYSFANSKLRSVFWGLALLCVFALIFNALAGAFKE